MNYDQSFDYHKHKISDFFIISDQIYINFPKQDQQKKTWLLKYKILTKKFQDTSPFNFYNVKQKQKSYELVSDMNVLMRYLSFDEILKYLKMKRTHQYWKNAKLDFGSIKCQRGRLYFINQQFQRKVLDSADEQLYKHWKQRQDQVKEKFIRKFSIRKSLSQFESPTKNLEESQLKLQLTLQAADKQIKQMKNKQLQQINIREEEIKKLLKYRQLYQKQKEHNIRIMDRIKKIQKIINIGDQDCQDCQVEENYVKDLDSYFKNFQYKIKMLKSSKVRIKDCRLHYINQERPTGISSPSIIIEEFKRQQINQKNQQIKELKKKFNEMSVQKLHLERQLKKIKQDQRKRNIQLQQSLISVIKQKEGLKSQNQKLTRSQMFQIQEHEQESPLESCQ